MSIKKEALENHTHEKSTASAVDENFCRMGKSCRVWRLQDSLLFLLSREMHCSHSQQHFGLGTVDRLQPIPFDQEIDGELTASTFEEKIYESDTQRRSEK